MGIHNSCRGRTPSSRSGCFHQWGLVQPHVNGGDGLDWGECLRESKCPGYALGDCPFQSDYSDCQCQSNQHECCLDGLRKSTLNLQQFNGFAAHINNTILMLNDIWNGLVNDIENTKRRFDELEAASMTTNEHLNDGLSAVLKSVDKLEIKGHSLQAMYDDMQTLVNTQERRI